MDNELERPVVKVDGSEMPDEMYEDLISLVVEQSVQIPDMFTMRFLDPHFDHFDKGTFTIGNDVELSFTTGDSIETICTATVTSISVESGRAGISEMVVTGLGHGSRLAAGSKLRNFLEVTDADMVTTIAGEHKLKTDIDATTTTYPWIVQEVDDFTFLTERALAIGFQWWVSDDVLHFKKQAKKTSASKLKWPDNLFTFDIRFSATEAIGDVTVRGWDSTTQEAFTAESAVVVGANELGSSAPAAAAADTSARPMQSNILDGLSASGDAVEAELLADSRTRQAAAEQVDGRGVALGDPLLRAGNEVEITGLGIKLSGKYVLTSVDHVYRAGEQYVTRFRAGGREPDGLVDLLRSPRHSPTSDVGSRLLPGVVTDINDPDKAGRVKVNLPTLGDDFPSDWARIGSLGAGMSRGLYMLPEVGDEVLVGFENANPRRPIILCGLWSKKLQAPVADAEAIVDDKVTLKGLYSRLGHKLEMSDGADDAAKSVSIELADGATKLRLGQDAVSLDAPTPLTVEGKDTISITSDDEITITADAKGITIKGGTITIEATKDLDLSGMNVSIKGKSAVTIEGATTDVKATGMLSVEAGGIAKVKGSMVQLG